MTEIEKKALALVNEVEDALGFPQQTVKLGDGLMATCLRRAIEQHEAFRQEVSDAVEAYWESEKPWPESISPAALSRFIIAKPDLVQEAIRELGKKPTSPSSDDLRAALAARGLEIREKQA